MKVQILPSAIQDLEDGGTFYDQQGEGLGQYFLDSLVADLDSLSLYGGIDSIHWGYHRMLAKRFPYAVYYKVTNPVRTRHALR